MTPRRRAGLLQAAGLLLIAFAGSRHAGLVASRSEHHLSSVPPEDTTPLVSLVTVAFGGFRGLVADALWVRANDLQERGQYFELVQLATWITQLEPRIPEVWSFHAWNMAYNISVLFPDPEDRWRWVTHGMHLLRDEGLRHNPTSAALHWDIGWLFQHKIGFDSDQAHFHYKIRWAETMQDLFQGPAPDYEAWARVPVTEEALLADAGAAGLVQALRSHLDKPLDYRSYQRDRPADAVSGLFASHPGAPAVLAYLRRQRLEKEFRMSLDTMRELDKDFGPLDWRLAHTHSLYWATRGLPYARDAFRGQTLRRMRMQSLAELTRRGRLVYKPRLGLFLTAPRLELIDLTAAAYERELAQSPLRDPLRRGYVSFLTDALLLQAEFGNEEDSFRHYRRLAAIENLDVGEAAWRDMINKYLVGADPADMGREQALNRVLALLGQARQWEVADEKERAGGLRELARKAHAAYQDSRRGEEHSQRTGLPPFEDMLRAVEAGEALP
jgi:hypothetical protein